MKQQEHKVQKSVLSGKERIEGLPGKKKAKPKAISMAACESALSGEGCIEGAGDRRSSKRSGTRKIGDVMSSDVALARPDETILVAAARMCEIDAGVLPVADNDRLVGMITDRDIAVRAVAEGKGPETPVRQVMSNEVCYCFDDETLADVAKNMASIKVRRLPVLTRQKRLVGIVSLSDIALSGDNIGSAICGISEAGGEHSQFADRQQA